MGERAKRQKRRILVELQRRGPDSKCPVKVQCCKHTLPQTVYWIRVLKTTNSLAKFERERRKTRKMHSRETHTLKERLRQVTKQ